MVRRVNQEFQFLQAQALELSRRYAGRYVALVGSQVVGVGATAQEAYEQAQQKRPDCEPVLKYFPPLEAVVL